MKRNRLLLGVLLIGIAGVIIFWKLSSKVDNKPLETKTFSVQQKTESSDNYDSPKDKPQAPAKTYEKPSSEASKDYIIQKTEEVMQQSKEDYDKWKNSEGYENMPKLEERRKLEYEIKTESRQEVLGKLQKERMVDVKELIDLSPVEESKMKNCFENRDLHALYLEQKRLKRYYEDKDSFTYEHVDAGEKLYDSTKLVECLESFLSGDKVKTFKQYLKDEIQQEQDALEAHREKMEPHRKLFDKYLEANGLKEAN